MTPSVLSDCCEDPLHQDPIVFLLVAVRKPSRLQVVYAGRTEPLLAVGKHRRGLHIHALQMNRVLQTVLTNHCPAPRGCFFFEVCVLKNLLAGVTRIGRVVVILILLLVLNFDHLQLSGDSGVADFVDVGFTRRTLVLRILHPL